MFLEPLKSHSKVLFSTDLGIISPPDSPLLVTELRELYFFAQQIHSYHQWPTERAQGAQIGSEQEEYSGYFKNHHSAFLHL